MFDTLTFASLPRALAQDDQNPTFASAWSIPPRAHVELTLRTCRNFKQIRAVPVASCAPVHGELPVRIMSHAWLPHQPSAWTACGRDLGRLKFLYKFGIDLQLQACVLAVLIWQCRPAANKTAFNCCVPSQVPCLQTVQLRQALWLRRDRCVFSCPLWIVKYSIGAEHWMQFEPNAC